MTKQEEEKFVEECRSWIGTRWMHGVAVKGFRVDCIQFLAVVAKTMGWIDKDYEIKPYPRDWALHRAESKILKEIGRFCDRVELKDIRVGDILLYKFDKCNSHAGFYLGGNKVIHSHIQYGVVVFDINDQEMKKRMTIAMRLKGDCP